MPATCPPHTHTAKPGHAQEGDRERSIKRLHQKLGLRDRWRGPKGTEGRDETSSPPNPAHHTAQETTRLTSSVSMINTCSLGGAARGTLGTQEGQGGRGWRREHPAKFRSQGPPHSPEALPQTSQLHLISKHQGSGTDAARWGSSAPAPQGLMGAGRAGCPGQAATVVGGVAGGRMRSSWDKSLPVSSYCSQEVEVG